MVSALFTSALFVGVGPACAWQDDDIFGPSTPAEPTNPETGELEPTGPPPIDSFDPHVRVVVESFRQANPSEPRKLADATRTLMNLELYSEAKVYLERLADLPLDDQALFDLNQSIGSDFFFRLSRSDEMAPEGYNFSARLMMAATKTANDPSRINELINQLGDDNIAVRSDASRELGRLGEVAIAQMITVFADGSRSAQYPSIRTSLQHIGASGLQPLVAASQSDNEQVQFESVFALTRVKDPEAFDAIVATYYSAKTPQRVKDIAYKAFVDQYGYFPDAQRASRTWFRRTNELLDDTLEIGARRLGFRVTPDRVWRWNPQQQKLDGFQLDETASRRIRAADKALVLAEINDTNQELQQLRLLTQLEVRKQLAGPTRRIDVAEFLESHNPDAENVSQALETALERNLVPAAIAACEVLEFMAEPSVLSSGTHRPCSLIQAILFGDRHLQYSATRAIAAMNPTRNFAGSSYFAQCAVYMANFAEQPGALIGNAREDLAITLAGRLIPSGLNGTTAANGREFYRMAIQDANLQFLLVCDTFHRPDYAELVQQLRQDWRTRRLPIAILYREENERRALRVADDDDLTVAMPFTVNPELVALQVGQLERFSSVWPVSMDDRRLHSEFAINWLIQAAQGGEDYAFLNLSSYEKQLGKLIYTRGMEKPAAQMIAALGTTQSQKLLVGYASETSLPIENRQAAAAAFKNSVDNNGILLKSNEILHQYDLYNASETDSQESQKVFGSILDTIESKTKTR